MKITDIYAQYQILPTLQLHMLRVAAVAEVIITHSEKQIDRKHILSACLLHDMGNILKFNFDLFPEFFEPEGTDYWRKIKDKFKQKYGIDEHEATIEIAKEIGVERRVIDLIDSFQFSIADKNKESQDIGKKICAYSDMRVEPMGVVSLQERLEEGRKRFYQNKPGLYDPVFFQQMSQSLLQMESDIFKKTDLTSSDITNERISPLIPELRKTEISS